MFDDFDLFETCEEYYDDAEEFERKYANDDFHFEYDDELVGLFIPYGIE